MDEVQQLRAENKQLKREVQELREKLTVAEAQIKHLAELLGQNSHNSSWPSSHDKGRQKPKPKSLRPQTERKAGGQEGHEGHTLEFNPKPDLIESHRPAQCSHCQAPLPEEIAASKVTKRQVFELPPLRYVTIEHQAETLICPCCGEATTGEFPADVSNPVQYGSQVKRLSVYLRNEQFIPYERERQMLADLFELPISTGSLQNFLETAAENVKPATEAIKEAVKKASELTYYEPHQSRGKKATDAIGILPEFTGALVHDNWATYFQYQLLLHALCNAHHLRELTALVENDQQQWAALMIVCLLAAKQLVAEAYQAGETELSVEQLQRIHQVYDTIVAFGLEKTRYPMNIRPCQTRRRKKTKARNLVERFDKQQEAILRFVHDFKVPFDNNLAERDIRMMKVQQKISGSFRSWEGAEQFCSLRTYISTIRKQGLNVWEALGSLFDDDVLMPQLTPV
ncbi:MAG: IS66 family transposase [Chloroflexi bacterium]|nr:IS66 family transposase [Chloroflexota bacterium]